MKKTGLVILYFLLPIILIVAILCSNIKYYGQGNVFIPMALGALAYTWLNMQLVISGRIKWIEAEFGLDKLLRFHGIMAIVGIVFALIHKQLKEMVFSEDSLVARIGTISFILFLVLSAIALILLADLLVDRVPFLQKIKKYITKIQIGKYHIQVLLHNLLAVGVIILFVHVMLTYSAQNLFVKLLYILYFAVSMGIYLYHKYVRPYIINPEFEVVHMKQESKFMTTITFKPLKGQVFHFKPGQFVFVKMKTGFMSQEAHPFSISSYSNQHDTISVTIKSIGDWTSKVNEIKIGDKATLDGPYGTFTIPKGNNKNLVFLSGGVGITPFVSLLGQLLDEKSTQKMLLFWGINSEEEMIWKSEFQKLEAGLQGFEFVPVIADGKNPQREKGYINDELCMKYLTKNTVGIIDTEFYICGPPVMQKIMIKMLRKLGVSKKSIHYEKFAL